MAMDRAGKEKQVEELTDWFGKAELTVFADYRGCNRRRRAAGRVKSMENGGRIPAQLRIAV